MTFHMKKMKFKFILITFTVSLFLTACGSGYSTSGSDQDAAASKQAASIHIDEAASMVELTIPKDYMESVTQEELDTAAADLGIESITLQQDGSALYRMTIEQHERMLADIKENIRAGMESMKQSSDYKNFVDITANGDYTEFTVTTTEERLDMKESFSVMTFYMYGEMYNMFKGTPAANIHVEFIHAETGAVVSAADSSNQKK